MLSYFFCLAQHQFGGEAGNQPDCSVGPNRSANPSNENPLTSLLLKIWKITLFFLILCRFFLQTIRAGPIRAGFFKLFLSHQEGQKPSKKNCIIEGFQAAMVMLALDLSEKLTKYIRPSIKLILQHFPYIDPMGICDNIKVPVNL